MDDLECCEEGRERKEGLEQMDGRRWRGEGENVGERKKRKKIQLEELVLFLRKSGWMGFFLLMFLPSV